MHTHTHSSCVSSFLKLLLNYCLVLIGQYLVTFYCNISNVKKNIVGRTIIAVHCVKLSKKKKVKKKKKGKKKGKGKGGVGK